jgi:pimeloyl-ACP methyl ester carboxylesterase
LIASAIETLILPCKNIRNVCYSPIIILHGEPDFDHNYLLPDMDRLSDSFRLIYYDHRGRGQSGSNVQPEDVTIESEIKDLESLREYFQLVSVAVLGHSWGGVLAMEYAIRHPNRVSHLILMNTAPASHNDYMLLREQLPHKRAPGDIEKLKAISSSAMYTEGDLKTDAEYYRIYFRATVRRPEQLEQVIKNLHCKIADISLFSNPQKKLEKKSTISYSWFFRICPGTTPNLGVRACVRSHPQIRTSLQRFPKTHNLY